MSRTVRRLTVAASGAATAVLLTAVPVAAHVEVESDNAQALAQNVELAFTAESESATAGITQLRIVLPKGITPSDVTYGKGPTGWKFSTTDDGYTVKGPAVKVGGDAEHSVVIRQLPDAKELVFKTLQTYSDGKVDRWIELGESDDGHGHGHGNEAPVLELKAAAPGATSESPAPSASASASPTPSAPASPTPTAEGTPQAADTEEDEGGGLSVGIWIAVAVVLVVAVVLAVRRRGRAQQ